MELKQLRYNMEEIAEEAANVLHNLTRGEAYTERELYQSIQHLRHHVNKAWNARNVSIEAAEEASADQQAQWGLPPADVRLI